MRRFVVSVVMVCCVSGLAEAQPVGNYVVVPTLSGLQFTPDGKTIVWSTSSGRAALSDGVTGKFRKWLDVNQVHIYGMALSPDGKQLATTSLDKTVHLWSLPEGKELRVLHGHTESGAAAFTPDGKTLASAGMDGIRLWNVADGKQRTFIPFSESRITSMAFSPDGKTLATSGVGGAGGPGPLVIESDWARLWDVETGKQTALADQGPWYLLLGGRPVPDDRRFRCP